MRNQCVLIPTFNNAATLREVLEGVFAYELPVVVVNDGSTDGTDAVLKRFPAVERIDFPVNRGKGYALEAGFQAALRHGWKRAVVIDSDLQHDPAEIGLFLDAACSRPNALIIGRRDMKKAGAPLRNRFGLTMSNFYFWFLAAAHLPDTQSGFRSYPLASVLDLHCAPSRFEYEFSLLVSAALAGIECVSIPITVTYDPERYVTHFRPVVDFVRIFTAGLSYLRTPFSGKKGR